MPWQTTKIQTFLDWARRRKWRLTILALLGFVYWAAPPYTFDPFCTYDLTYRLDATIEVDGARYQARATHQQSKSRRWIAVMNSAGCLPKYGTALPFRLPDNRLILLRARICPSAQEQLAGSRQNYCDGDFHAAMWAHRKVDLKPYCHAISFDQTSLKGRLNGADGYVIDNADHPTRWKPFELGDALPGGGAVRLVSAIAEAGDDRPTDDLDRVAPAVLKTGFKYSTWWDSPEAILSFERRYSRSKGFAYEADEWR